MCETSCACAWSTEEGRVCVAETPGGGTPAELPEPDGCAASAGPTRPAGTGSAGTTDADTIDAGIPGSADAGAAEQDGAGVAEQGNAGAAEQGDGAARRQARRTRLQDLAGVTVLGSDGGQVGRVRDIYLHDATAELAAITVVRRQLSSASVLIPTAAIAVLPAPHTEPDESDEQRRADSQVEAARHGGDSAGADESEAARRGDDSAGADESGVAPEDRTGAIDGADDEAPDGADHSEATHRRATARRTADRERRRTAADRDADPAHPQALWLRVDAESARAGLGPPDTLHATPQRLREAARAIGLEEAAG